MFQVQPVIEEGGGALVHAAEIYLLRLLQSGWYTLHKLSRLQRLQSVCQILLKGIHLCVETLLRTQSLDG